MDRRLIMSDRSFRLFQIIQILRAARRPLTAQDIATQLEVTKRTIYRDIATLQGAHVPIQGEAGVGYVMRRGYDLPPLMFSAEEVEAIVVGLSLIGRTRDAALEGAAASVLQKVEQVLPAALSGEKPLFVSQWSAVPEAGGDHGLIRLAIRNEAKLGLTYADAEGQRTRRVVLPLALVYYVDSTILAAWCELRQDFRHFRLDRIAGAERLGQSFAGQGHRLREIWRRQAPSFLRP